MPTWAGLDALTLRFDALPYVRTNLLWRVSVGGFDCLAEPQPPLAWDAFRDSGVKTSQKCKSRNTTPQLVVAMSERRVALAPEEIASLSVVSALPAEYPGWMLERQGLFRRPRPFTQTKTLSQTGSVSRSLPWAATTGNPEPGKASRLHEPWPSITLSWRSR